MSTKPADAERRNARLSPLEQRGNAAAVRTRRACRRREAKLYHAMRSVAGEVVGMAELIRHLPSRAANETRDLDSGPFAAT